MLVAAALAAGATVGCGSKSSSASGPPTGWAAIEAKIAPDGSVDTQTALEAFSYIFGPMPGVSLPSNVADHGPGPGDGTAAVTWLLSHLKDLTAAQVKAAAGYITGDNRGSAGKPETAAGLPGAPTGLAAIETRTQPITRAGGSPTTSLPPNGLADAVTTLLKDTVADEGKKANIGVSGLKVQATLIPTDPRKAGGQYYADAWTYASIGKGLDLNQDLTKELTHYEGPVTRCDVYVPVHTWTNLPAGTLSLGTVGGHLAEVIAHEAFHCVQAYSIGAQSVEAFDNTAKWIIEGSAAWAGADEAQYNDYHWWNWWLTEIDGEGGPATSVIERAYSAIGFYSAIQQAGTSPWSLFAPVFTAKGGSAALDNAAAFTAFTTPVPSLRDVWPSDYFRKPDWGADWEPKGLGIPDSLGPSIPDLVATTSPYISTVAPYTAAQKNIRVADTKQVLVVVADHKFRLRDDSGKVDRRDVTGIGLCMSETACKPCPSDSTAPKLPVATQPVHVGLTGVGEPLRYTVVAVTLDEYCKHPPKGNPGQPSGGGNGGGSPETPTTKPPDNGGPHDAADPHLRTVDGFSYDFQAVGEFDTIEAGDGFDVQTRKELVGHSTSVSANTGVAVDVMGDHVAVYLRLGGLELDIGGAAVATPPVGPLPNGGTVEALDGGYQIGWPDGSTVEVLPFISLGLSVVAHLAPGRLTQAAGLLGPAPGHVLTARDGTKITFHAPVIGQQSYTDLYRTFGDSWRVGAARSLFTYTGGRTYEDYDLRQYPTTVATVATLPTAARTAAAQQCASISDDTLKDNCTLDVALVAGSDPTTAAAIASSYATLVTAESAVAPPPTIGSSLVPGDSVTGRSIGPNQTQDYTLTVDHDQTVYFRHGDVLNKGAAYPNDPTWTLKGPDDHTILGASIQFDIGRMALTAGKYTIEVDTVGRPQASAAYGFSVLVVPADEDFSISIGTAVSPGHPAAGAGDVAGWGAHDVYSFHADAGETVSVHITNCMLLNDTVGWRIYAADGSQLGRGQYNSFVPPDCDTEATITFQETGDYTIIWTADESGAHDIAPFPAFPAPYYFTLEKQ